jgi:NADH-quinone oxidoreductase subunit H
MVHVIPPTTQTYAASLLCAVIIVLALPLLAACILIVERKIMAETAARHDAANSGFHSLLQPIADAVKLILQKDSAPTSVDRLVFWVAPLISMLVALLAFSVLPVGPAFQIADVNVGLLFILGIVSLGIYGLFLGDWASNHQYSPSAALCRADALVSYQLVGILGLISALLLAGSLSMREIVQSQLDQGQWFVFYVPVGFVIYFIGSLVATNHAPVESLDGTRKIVDEQTTEYSGFRWFLHFLTEYTNMIIFAGVATTVFLGGWLRPLASYRDRFPGSSIELLDVMPVVVVAGIAVYCFRRALKQPVKIRRTGTWYVGGTCAFAAVVLAASWFAPEAFMQGVHGAFWFLVKAGGYIYCLLRVRFMFPRLRLGFSTQLAWRVLVPVACVNLITVAVAILTAQDTGLPMRLTTILSTLVALAIAWWLSRNSADIPGVLATDGE